MKLIIAQGVEGPSAYLNGHRIAGKKPWGGSISSKEFDVTTRDVCEALRGTSIDYASLLARHNALVEAVAWEREAALHWEFGRIKRFIAEREALESMFSSRSEVDRLIAEREG